MLADYFQKVLEYINIILGALVIDIGVSCVTSSATLALSRYTFLSGLPGTDFPEGLLLAYWQILLQLWGSGLSLLTHLPGIFAVLQLIILCIVCRSRDAKSLAMFAIHFL